MVARVADHMRRSIGLDWATVAGLGAALGIFSQAAATEPIATMPIAEILRVTDQQARKCGWFAVLDCFSTRMAAFRYNDQVETGHTIATDRRDFPTFKPGLFCVVKGPGSLDEATEWRSTFKGIGIKKAC
jgi:hypothetical protein